MSKHAHLIKTFAKGELSESHAKSKSQNAVIYTRVSSKEQLDNMSLETQLKSCVEFAKRYSYEVSERFGGTYESAMSDERKEFVRMINFVKKSKEKISYIIVYSIERFSRTGDNAIWLSRQLRELGITIVSVTQPIDTSNPSGVLQQNILFLFSQYDNDLRRQKCIAGMKEKLLKGEWMGVLPMGYQFDRSGGTREQKVVFNEDAHLIKKAFMMRLRGTPNVEIAEKITKMGLRLTYKRLTETLRNPFYCGYVTHALLEGEVIKGKHMPVVSEEIFLQVNDLLNKTHTGIQHKEENDNLPMKRFIKCAECESPLTGYVRKKKLKNGKVLHFHYYKCYTRGCNCNRSVKVLHDKFKDFLIPFQLKRELLPLVKKQLEITFTCLSESIETESKSMKTKLSDLNSRLEKVEDRFAEGEIERSIYEKSSNKLKAEIKQLSSELEQSSVKISNPSLLIDKSLAFACELASWWEKGDYQEKKMVQEILFPEGITFDKENDAFRTSSVNKVIELIAQLSEGCEQNKRRQTNDEIDLSPSVVPTGIEPASKV